MCAVCDCGLARCLPGRDYVFTHSLLPRACSPQLRVFAKLPLSGKAFAAVTVDDSADVSGLVSAVAKELMLEPLRGRLSLFREGETEALDSAARVSACLEEGARLSVKVALGATLEALGGGSAFTFEDEASGVAFRVSGLVKGEGVVIVS
jgi:hypothetical protein